MMVIIMKENSKIIYLMDKVFIVQPFIMRVSGKMEKRTVKEKKCGIMVSLIKVNSRKE